MEKRRIRKKDISRMDGLLPPTLRVPVCDAVTSDKKKEKKWSIGGLFKRISSIRDYESSSNEEEMVYCKRVPRNHNKVNRKSDGVVVQPVQSISGEANLDTRTENSVCHSLDSLNVCRDSIHSRSSDGSLEGLGKKMRKSKLKARAEAKRDLLCPESSSDEDSRKSNNSLAKYQYEECTQKNNSFSRKTRAARTERYIKRLSKDEGNGGGNGVNEISNKRNTLEYPDDHIIHSEVNGSYRPPVHPRRFGTHSNNHVLPSQKFNTEDFKKPDVGLPDPGSGFLNDFSEDTAGQYITDLNQNTTCEKSISETNSDKYYGQYHRNHFLNASDTNIDQNGRNSNYADDDFTINYPAVNRSSCPPEPPPRDPRCRVFNYGYYSFPFNNKHPQATRFDSYIDARTNEASALSNPPNPRLYSSNNEIACDSMKQNLRYPECNERSSMFSTSGKCSKNTSLYNYTNNTRCTETEVTKCQRKNKCNNLLNSITEDHKPSSPHNSTRVYEKNKFRNTKIIEQSDQEPIYGSILQPHANHSSKLCDTKKSAEEPARTSPEDKRRSSKNLEEALSELEAIYNSLRLGDEDLLDRAERRSMEEFSLKHSKPEEPAPLDTPDSPDRTKDDMAYRRMHPKERPTSLSDVAGQSALSNISYLIASPILSRKDTSADDYLCKPSYPTRRTEPDVTRDDVVFRSISHANNTLKVIDPQPPFGIPLGPVTTATESDYLHTTPSKPDHPRSPYIPQCEPDIVTDDLAYRTLRKDANTKSAGESKADGQCESGTGFGMRKKRAVRSMSANLYGLINHDRIHLRRTPDIPAGDKVNDATTDILFPGRYEYFRRVVSDGELTDQDTDWRSESTVKDTIDINGNHPATDLYRKKLRVYVSPETSIRETEEQKSKTDSYSHIASSDTTLSSKTLDDDLWHDRLQSDSPVSNKGIESDFTAYSRLCQDLVNLIKVCEDTKVNSTAAEKTNSSASSPRTENVHTDSSKPSTLHIQSLGSHYSNLNDPDLPTEFPDTKITNNFELPSRIEETEKKANDLDFYLRLADENVKLIAEAFSSVADHLRDSQLTRKNSPSSRHVESENDSTTQGTSTRSSTYSQEDTNDERASLSRTEESSKASNRNSLTTEEGDQAKTELSSYEKYASVDLDLYKAVRDLEIAAASLKRNEKEIEQLSVRDRRSPGFKSTEEEALIPEDSKEEREEVSAGKGDESEGERTERVLDCKANDADASVGMRVTRVTNIITITITTYTVVLFACFLALLLAILAAL